MRGFLPSSGKLKHMSVPESRDRVRIETGVRQGDEVSLHILRQNSWKRRFTEIGKLFKKSKF